MQFSLTSTLRAVYRKRFLRIIRMPGETRTAEAQEKFQQVAPEARSLIPASVIPSAALGGMAWVRSAGKDVADLGETTVHFAPSLVLTVEAWDVRRAQDVQGARGADGAAAPAALAAHRARRVIAAVLNSPTELCVTQSAGTATTALDAASALPTAQAGLSILAFLVPNLRMDVV